MVQRVLATRRAEQAAQRIHSLLNGDIRAQLAAVKQQGQKLATPSVWDGPAAERFRTQWPSTLRVLDQATESLDNLDRSSETVIDNIIKTGSEGTIGVPGVPAGPGGPGGPGGLDLGQAMLLGLHNYFLPPTALGGPAVGLWATRRGLTVFGGFQTWMTTARWREFAPGGVPTNPSTLSWWRYAWQARADGNWIAKPGVSATTRTALEDAGRLGGRVSGVLAIGSAALGQWIQDSGNRSLDTNARIGRTAYAGLVTGGATCAGTMAGAELGSAIGTLAIPIPGVGTAVGGIIGGIAGAIIGSGVGNFVVSNTVDSVGHAADAVGHWLSSINPF